MTSSPTRKLKAETAVPDWMDDALCRESPSPDLWFSYEPADQRAAKAVCGECPVKQPCLEYALKYKIGHGCWGGTSERERERIRKAVA